MLAGDGTASVLGKAAALLAAYARRLCLAAPPDGPAPVWLEDDVAFRYLLKEAEPECWRRAWASHCPGGRLPPYFYPDVCAMDVTNLLLHVRLLYEG